MSLKPKPTKRKTEKRGNEKLPEITMKKTQRRYPDVRWDYKAVSTITYNLSGTKIDVYYYTLMDKGKISEGVEVLSGPNYLKPIDAKGKSFLRHYTLDKVPKYLVPIVKELKREYAKTKWSTAKRVDLN
jgi:hypothetical protein